MNTQQISYSAAHSSCYFFGVYQRIHTQRQFRNGKKNSSWEKVQLPRSFSSKQNQGQTQKNESNRKALVVSTDKTLQHYFDKRLKQKFNFDHIEFATNKNELLVRAKHSFMWIIVAEDFTELSLKETAEILGDHSQHAFIYIGEAEKSDVAKLGFDAVFKKRELAWNEI
jgi:hypothetical protein